MCTLYVPDPRRSEENIRSPGSGVTEGFESPWGCWELTLSEPSLQPQALTLLLRFFCVCICRSLYLYWYFVFCIWHSFYCCLHILPWALWSTGYLTVQLWYLVQLIRMQPCFPQDVLGHMHYPSKLPREFLLCQLLMAACHDLDWCWQELLFLVMHGKCVAWLFCLLPWPGIFLPVCFTVLYDSYYTIYNFVFCSFHLLYTFYGFGIPLNGYTYHT